MSGKQHFLAAAAYREKPTMGTNENKQALIWEVEVF